MGAEKIEIVHVSMTADELVKLVRGALREEIANIQPATDLLDIDDAAKEIGCSVTALHKRIQRGHIKPDKLGGKDGFKSHQFTRATIAEYKRSNKR